MTTLLKIQTDPNGDIDIHRYVRGKYTNQAVITPAEMEELDAATYRKSLEASRTTEPEDELA